MIAGKGRAIIYRAQIKPHYHFSCEAEDHVVGKMSPGAQKRPATKYTEPRCIMTLAWVGAALVVHKAFILKSLGLIVSKIHILVSVNAKMGVGFVYVLTLGPHSAWEKYCAEVGIRTRLPFFSR
jgi:hypothetical protein